MNLNFWNPVICKCPFRLLKVFGVGEAVTDKGVHGIQQVPKIGLNLQNFGIIIQRFKGKPQTCVKKRSLKKNIFPEKLRSHILTSLIFLQVWKVVLE